MSWAVDARQYQARFVMGCSSATGAAALPGVHRPRPEFLPRPCRGTANGPALLQLRRGHSPLLQYYFPHVHLQCDNSPSDHHGPLSFNQPPRPFFIKLDLHPQLVAGSLRLDSYPSSILVLFLRSSFCPCAHASSLPTPHKSAVICAFYPH
jgi:hypothetical protein